jgi:ABC-2 type transport system ATP-binding protein
MISKLEIKNLNFSYEGSNKSVLKNINLKLNPNDIVCIRGENGSGKTTLLKILSGLIKVDIPFIFNGLEVNEINEYKRKIAYISDEPYLYEELTGIQNLKLIMNLWNEDKLNYMDKCYELCKEFKLENSLNELVGNYSLGMKHKLFLIAMLTRETELIFLDEPLNALDLDSQYIAIELLKKYAKDNKAILFVTHIENIQNSLANIVFSLNNGILKEVR